MGILMMKYIAQQIIQNKLKYTDVISAHPEYRHDLDNILKEHNMQHLIKEMEN